MSSAELLVDRCDRVHHELRISVTDRCDPRCVHCMPEEDTTCLPRSQPLTYEEITSWLGWCDLAAASIRRNGNEPLIPKELPVLMSHNVVSSPAPRYLLRVLTKIDL
jgi:molybdenum cofactor biosynthesis enzyme MoaA